MADSVKIVFDAVDKATGTMAKIQMGFSTFNNVLYAAESIARKVGEALDATVGVAVDYANEVRNLQLASGQSAEETSKLIQVFDDFKIKASELTPVIRAMTKEGLVPNIESIARLADEYNKLPGPLEKNAFLMKNFGRSGLEMAEMMSKGGDAIREMGDSVNAMLLQTQKAQDEARAYELALDDLTDASEGLKVQIGNALIPTLTDLATELTREIEIAEQEIAVIRELGDSALASAAAFGFWGTVIQETLNLLGLLPKGEIGVKVGFSTSGFPEVEAQIEELKNEQKLNFILDFQSNADQFEADKEKILSDMTELKDKIIALREEMAAGTADEGAPEDLAAMEEELRGLTGSLEEGKAAFQKWQKQAVFALLQTKMAADGLTDVEFEQLLQVGQDMGLLDPEVVQQAQDLMGAITGVDASSLGDAVNDVKYLVGQDGRTITIYVNQVETTTTTESGTGTGTSGTGGQGAETNAAGTTTSGIPVVNLTFTMPGTYNDVLAFLRG